MSTKEERIMWVVYASAILVIFALFLSMVAYPPPKTR
jgi:hypothetical protein